MPTGYLCWRGGSLDCVQLIWLRRTGRLISSSGALRGEERRPLLDDLVRPQQQRRRDSQSERLRRLPVHHQRELGGLLNRKVGRLGSPENSVD